MRMPHLNLSPVTMSNNYGHYLLVRLQAVPEVAPVLEYFLTVRGAVQAAIQAYDDAVRARQAAIAVRDFNNDRMDEETRVLAFTILGRVRNNRTAPVFRNYFPRGYSEVIETPINEQRRRSVVLLEKLEAERDETIRTRLEPFRAQLQSLGDSLDAYEQSRDDEARMRGNREMAKLVWLEGYRRTFHQLQNFYSGDPRQAETFFRRIRPRGSVDESEALLDFETETEFDDAQTVEADVQIEDLETEAVDAEAEPVTEQ